MSENKCYLNQESAKDKINIIDTNNTKFYKSIIKIVKT